MIHPTDQQHRYSSTLYRDRRSCTSTHRRLKRRRQCQRKILRSLPPPSWLMAFLQAKALFHQKHRRTTRTGNSNRFRHRQADFHCYQATDLDGSKFPERLQQQTLSALASRPQPNTATQKERIQRQSFFLRCSSARISCIYFTMLIAHLRNKYTQEDSKEFATAIRNTFVNLSSDNLVARVNADYSQEIHRS